MTMLTRFPSASGQLDANNQVLNTCMQKSMVCKTVAYERYHRWESLNKQIQEYFMKNYDNHKNT